MVKKLIFCIMLLWTFIFSACGATEWMENAIINLGGETYDETMKQDLLCLMMAYPGYIVNIKRTSDDNVYLIMKSGTQILYDDKKNKTFNEKLGNGDLQDMMEQIYPLYDINNLMPKDFDPGRIRVYSLLKEVYGGSKKQVESNLVTVKSGYEYHPFNISNGASESLKSVMNELVPLVKSRQDIRSNVFPTSGTFNYRYIAGTSQLSPHSFGIAIDLARDKRDYWKWASREEGEKRLKSYPKEIVQVFEKNGFVWGGKWMHFDILHFEYRPELILKARYFGNRSDENKLWYDGAPIQDAAVKNYIELIENGLK